MELPMSPKGAIFLGLNGEGKTNLIEAIHTLSLGHSHRTSRDQEMILWGEKYFYLKAEGIKKEGRFISEVLVGDKGKKVKINHQQAKKVSELMGHCNTVIFSPEDLYLTKGPESIRRKYMNKELSQVDSLYKNHLLKYHRILKRRNHYLRYHKERFDEDVLMSLTEQLTEEAGFLIDQRRRFTEEISAIAEEIYGTFTQNQEKLTITYEPKVASKDELYEKLKKAREEELKRGTTLYGPHLDDLRVKVKDYDLRRFGSQGQQRSGALAMKIAEIRYIEHKTKDKPLLLLDDVMSEHGFK